MRLIRLRNSFSRCAVWPRTDRIVLGSRIDAGRLPPGHYHHGQAARQREHFLALRACVHLHARELTLREQLQGIPIGAIMMKDKVADVIKIGDHGTTFGFVAISPEPLPMRG